MNVSRRRIGIAKLSAPVVHDLVTGRPQYSASDGPVPGLGVSGATMKSRDAGRARGTARMRSGAGQVPGQKAGWRGQRAANGAAPGPRGRWRCARRTRHSGGGRAIAALLRNPAARSYSWRSHGCGELQAGVHLRGSTQSPSEVGCAGPHRFEQRHAPRGCRRGQVGRCKSRRKAAPPRQRPRLQTTPRLVWPPRAAAAAAGRLVFGRRLQSQPRACVPDGILGCHWRGAHWPRANLQRLSHTWCRDVASPRRQQRQASGPDSGPRPEGAAAGGRERRRTRYVIATRRWRYTRSRLPSRNAFPGGRGRCGEPPDRRREDGRAGDARNATESTPKGRRHQRDRIPPASSRYV